MMTELFIFRSPPVFYKYQRCLIAHTKLDKETEVNAVKDEQSRENENNGHSGQGSREHRLRSEARESEGQ